MSCVTRALAALLVSCSGVAYAQPPSWWPFGEPDRGPSPQSPAAAIGMPQAQFVQAQAITVPALPYYQQSPMQMRYVGPGPIRRAVGNLGERMATLKRGHYVVEPPQTLAPMVQASSAAPQQPIVVVVTVPAQGPAQPAVAPSAQGIQAATAAPPPPKLPGK